jgi:DNA-binding SARP family transcriptional activator
MAVTFQQAYEAAIKKYLWQDWLGFDPSQQTAAIYEEMRRMDEEAADKFVVSESNSSEALQVQDVSNSSPSSIPRQKK